MGKMAASHVTPTDHLYIERDPLSGPDQDYVRAPADGKIVEIERWLNDRELPWDSSQYVPDYRVIIMHTCDLFTIFIHLGELAPEIEEQTGEIHPGEQWFSQRSGAVDIKAGDPIARFGVTSLDWSVHDGSVELSGFVVPVHYDREPWKIHTVDPFQYYSDPLKTELMAKVPRVVSPVAGKIDYDIEGKIVGNWFLEGTDDYGGNIAPGSSVDYWTGHLAIAYGYIDPSQIRISIGFVTGIEDEALCNTCFGAYGVRGNQPDPATVGPEKGLVKYELMSRVGPNHEQVGAVSLGTFLVRHHGDRTLEVEVIPGKTPDEVSNFSDASLIYHR